MSVLISSRAEEDLACIFAYLWTHHDPEAAERFRFRVEKAIRQLAENAELGPHPAWATRHKRVRFWIISKTNYIIFYEPTSQGLSIERILDGRRDVRRIIELGIEEPPAETT